MERFKVGDLVICTFLFNMSSFKYLNSRIVRISNITHDREIYFPEYIDGKDWIADCHFRRPSLAEVARAKLKGLL